MAKKLVQMDLNERDASKGPPAPIFRPYFRPHEFLALLKFCPSSQMTYMRGDPLGVTPMTLESIFLKITTNFMILMVLKKMP